MFKRFLKICVTIAVISSPSFSFQVNSSTNVTDNPKEIIDQVWQTIYRDFLDYSGKYDVDKWIKLRKELLTTQYINNDAAYEAVYTGFSALFLQYDVWMHSSFKA